MNAPGWMLAVVTGLSGSAPSTADACSIIIEPVRWPRADQVNVPLDAWLWTDPLAGDGRPELVDDTGAVIVLQQQAAVGNEVPFRPAQLLRASTGHTVTVGGQAALRFTTGSALQGVPPLPALNAERHEEPWMPWDLALEDSCGFKHPVCHRRVWVQSADTAVRVELATGEGPGAGADLPNPYWVGPLSGCRARDGDRLWVRPLGINGEVGAWEHVGPAGEPLAEGCSHARADGTSAVGVMAWMCFGRRRARAYRR